MHDDIGAELEWLLEAWWGEGAIDDKVCAAGVSFSGVGCNIKGGALGVDGRFEKDYISFFEFLG